MRCTWANAIQTWWMFNVLSLILSTFRKPIRMYTHNERKMWNTSIKNSKRYYDDTHISVEFQRSWKPRTRNSNTCPLWPWIKSIKNAKQICLWIFIDVRRSRNSNIDTHTHNMVCTKTCSKSQYGSQFNRKNLYNISRVYRAFVALFALQAFANSNIYHT